MIRTVHVVAAAAAAAVCLAAPASDAAAKDPEPAQPTVVFLVPDPSHPDHLRAEEVRWGIEAAFASGTVLDPKIAFRTEPLPPEGKVETLAAAWKKSPPDAVLAWCPDGRVRELEEFAEKRKHHLVVLSPEATRMSMDPARTVLWAGGVEPIEEAMQAMDFLLLPGNSHRPAILHDGSARALDAAARCAVLHHVSQEVASTTAVTAAFDGKAMSALLAKESGAADGFIYFGNAPGAERVLRAAEDAKLPQPVLLGQGLATRAVPTFASGGARNAWALEVCWFEDHEGVAKDDHPILDDAAKKCGTPVLAGLVRGYRAGRWTMDALRESAGDPKKLGAAFRALNHPGARGRFAFDATGHKLLGRFEAWRSPAERKEPAFRRLRRTQLPMAGIPQIGTFRASQFQWAPGTVHVHCTWAEGAERTIEKDLKAIGIGTGGYEAAMEEKILDDLMGRFLSRMHRLFRRRADGTEIPGVSYRVSFTTEPPGKDVKGPKFQVILAGDDPEAGGRASGSVAKVFTTFLQRTIYAKLRLDPPVGATDHPYLAGTYRWDTSLEQNLRCDKVRALLDGYSQGLALTGAHEIGHICGLGHDQVTPRSIMNVVDAVGLDFEWAEWIPEHEKVVQRALGRAPEAKDAGKR
ncbi:MAG: hypothetical protein HMLKMBBP_03525 [Planctomycetes bacterium]|nr:hypothetical protein [Planctomycetota bacterium]